MKKLLFLSFCCLLAACGKDEPQQIEPKFHLDPTAKVYIKPATPNSQRVKSVFSSLDIVKRANAMRFYNDSLSKIVGGTFWTGGFYGKDTTSETPAFLRVSTDFISIDGFGKPCVVPDFIYAYDIAIIIFRSNDDIDTIAYIPNVYMREGERQIKEALQNKDTASIYNIYQNNFKFLPITGSEYKELKRKHLN